jgi:ABC-type multidrug transport system fused ATPase/permease subunit
MRLPQADLVRDVGRALSLLSRRDRGVLIGLMGFQASLSLLDLIAIGALGLVTAAAAALASSTPVAVPAPFGAIADRLTSPSAIVWVAVAAGLLLLTKSVVSFWGTRRAFRFLANRQAMISSRLADELLSRPLLQVLKRSTQENSFALTAGVMAMTSGLLGQLVIVVTEVSLALVLLAGLFLVDPWLTMFTGFFFGLIAFSLHFLLAKWAQRIGQREAVAAAKGTQQVQEAIRGYREVVVSGRRGVYTSRFQALVWDVAKVQSDRMMITSISKYVFELALIIGAGLLLLSQAALGNLAAGAATVVVFFTAASRIMPALMRLQAATLAMKLSSGTSLLTWDLLEELNGSTADDRITADRLRDMYRLSQQGYPGFVGTLQVTDATLTYPGATEFALDGVSIAVSNGEAMALVGPSGAGKSTLADVILGVIAPDAGVAEISGHPASEVVREWPGALAYVPQDVAILDGTVRENVAMGLPEALINDDRVQEALHRAHLSSFLNECREGLDTLVGEHGVKLSGGQRQRLGIARALYTRPRFLVLDEATSALDAQTEFDISETITEMSGEVTRVIIAHRLATIRNCDVVVYLDHGRVVASGTFDEVRNAIPDFDRQAELLGL